MLGALIGAEFDAIQSGATRETRIPMRAGDDLDVWEQRLEKVVETDQKIPETDREAIIRAQRRPRIVQAAGQPDRKNVQDYQGR